MRTEGDWLSTKFNNLKDRIIESIDGKANGECYFDPIASETGHVEMIGTDGEYVFYTIEGDDEEFSGEIHDVPADDLILILKAVEKKEG